EAKPSAECGGTESDAEDEEESADSAEGQVPRVTQGPPARRENLPLMQGSEGPTDQAEDSNSGYKDSYEAERALPVGRCPNAESASDRQDAVHKAKLHRERPGRCADRGQLTDRLISVAVAVIPRRRQRIQPYVQKEGCGAA